LRQKLVLLRAVNKNAKKVKASFPKKKLIHRFCETFLTTFWV